MIRAIIFDLGGVLLRTSDFSPREHLAQRLNTDRRGLEELIFGGESGEKAQKGVISVQQHWINLATRLEYSPQEVERLVEEFFAHDMLDLDLLDYIRSLHRHYKTALLSNAWDDLRRVITERWHFEDAFDELIISAEVGLVKPDPRIFELAVARLGVEADQAVFIDDMQLNVEGARRVGLQGVWFQNPKQIKSNLSSLLDGNMG